MNNRIKLSTIGKLVRTYEEPYCIHGKVVDPNLESWKILSLANKHVVSTDAEGMRLVDKRSMSKEFNRTLANEPYKGTFHLWNIMELIENHNSL